MGLEAVANGEMVGTVYNDKEEGQAEAMLDLAQLSVDGDLSGLDLEDGKYIRLPYSKVGADDVEEYISGNRKE